MSIDSRTERKRASLMTHFTMRDLCVKRAMKPHLQDFHKLRMAVTGSVRRTAQPRRMTTISHKHHHHKCISYEP